MNKTNEPLHERSGHVGGLGMVRVTTAQCICGRLMQPTDFQMVADDQIRAVCAACHADLIRIDDCKIASSEDDKCC